MSDLDYIELPLSVYGDNAIIYLSEVFSFFKDDETLNKILKSTPNQRKALREHVRHVLAHEMDSVKRAKDVHEFRLKNTVNWGEEFKIVKGFALGLIMEQIPRLQRMYVQDIENMKTFVENTKYEYPKLKANES